MSSSTLENQPDLRSTIKSWVDKTDKTLNLKLWVVCPVCKEEWTMLKECRFLKFENEKVFDDADSMCVECAESLKSFPAILGRYPISGEIESLIYNWAGPSYVKYKWPESKEGPARVEKVPLHRNRTAALKCEGVNFVIRSAPTGIMLNIADQPEEYLDNILAAISRINLALHRFSDAKHTGKY